MSYDNTNTLKIWKTQKKNPKEPDYKIDVNLDGQEFQIPIWKRKEDANPNGPIFTGKIERPQQSISAQAQAKIRKPDPISTGRQDMNDDIPF